jgi:phosphotransferase system HPr-like phosphotransfer protein
MAEKIPFIPPRGASERQRDFSINKVVEQCNGVSDFARTLLDDASAAAVLASLGVMLEFGTIADDGVSTLSLSSILGAFLLIAPTSGSHARPALLWVRAATTPECQLIVENSSASGQSLLLGTSALTGTTNADGRISVAATSAGNLHVENRRGFSIAVRGYLFRIA